MTLGFAQGSNTGPGLGMPGGAPLCHSCYGSVLRKMSIFAKFAPKGPQERPYFSARRQSFQKSQCTFSVLRLDWRISEFCHVSR